MIFKKILLLSVFVAVSLSLAVCYHQNAPVQVIDVYHEKNFSDVLVLNFPDADHAKITWWLKNRAMLAKGYSVPHPSDEGHFTVTFWDFRDGYIQDDGSDILCFHQASPVPRCIKKNAVLEVSNNNDGTLIFRVYDGTYVLEKNGVVVKIDDR